MNNFSGEENSQNNNNSKQDDKIQPLRTFNDDVSNLVTNQNISTARIMLAEEEKRRQQQAEQEIETVENRKKALSKFIISILLIAIGISTIYVAFKYDLMPKKITNLINGNEKNNEIVSQQLSIKIVLETQNSAEFKTKLFEAIDKIGEKTFGQIIGFDFKKVETVIEGGQEKRIETNITTQDFFSLINSNADDRLIRSLEDIFLIAIYIDVENMPFIIFKTNDINLSFAEMYQWEKNLYKEVKDILSLKEEVPEFIEIPIESDDNLEEKNNESEGFGENIINDEVNDENNENATSTEPIILVEKIPNPEPKFNSQKFSDIVISNRDVRAVIDEAGAVILLYSFIDEENIVITKDTKTLQEIIKKISAKRLIR